MEMPQDKTTTFNGQINPKERDTCKGVGDYRNKQPKSMEDELDSYIKA